MKFSIVCACVLLTIGCEKQNDRIKSIVKQEYFKPLIEELTSDELLGRDTGSEGIHKAAEILSTAFETIGTNYVPNSSSFKQSIVFYKKGKLIDAKIELTKGFTFTSKSDQVGILSGEQSNVHAPSITISEFNQEDADKGLYQGKVIISNHPEITQANFAEVTALNESLYKSVVQAGALGLIQFMPKHKTTSWKNYFASLNRSTISTKKSDNTVPHLLIDNDGKSISRLKNQKVVHINLEIEPTQILNDANIAAFVPGTDSEMKNEIIVVSAHYDHVGYQKGLPSNQDSIYNGARDNAIGAVALVIGAKVLVSIKPKRSVLFLALTGEEKGLLGSAYYVQNPLLPLNRTIFNLNLDGAGYNDTTIATLVGLGNYKQDSLLVKAVNEMGITAKPDPVPQFNLFQRSDNIRFSEKGIPSLTYSLGFTDFGDELMKVYHQPADEASTLDYDYIERFYEGFASLLLELTNGTEKMEWKDDQPWAAKAKDLYQN